MVHDSGRFRDGYGPQEAAAGLWTRGGFLARALAASGAAGGVAVAGASAANSGSAVEDIRILNFLLLMEYAQRDFYARPPRRLRGDLREFAQVAGEQEREHVALLQRTLGKYARRRPAVRFHIARTPKAFAAAAVRLEEAGAAAYIGQGGNLSDASVGTVARITSVEARHAAWIRDIVGDLPAPSAADRAAAPVEALARLRRLASIKVR